MNRADERHLRRAIELASTARAAGQHPYGSLLVSADGQVLAEDYNTELDSGDITAHPELKLARRAAQRLAPAVARTTTTYRSCKPCPMCRRAIARSGLGRVVFALSAEHGRPWRHSAPRKPPTSRTRGPALLAEARVPLGGYYG